MNLVKKEIDVTEQDIKIIELIRKNDSFALDMIYDQYSRVIYGAIYAKCYDSQLTEELFQETFEKIAVKRSSLARSNNLKSYLIRMSINVVNDYFRKKKKEIEPEEYSLFEKQKSKSTYSEKWLEMLRRELGKLPEDQNKVVMLKVFEKQTFKDIAELLGISANTAASRYRYALLNLKKALNFGELNDD